MPQEQITGDTGPLGAGGQLQVYKVPGSALVSPNSVSAVLDGTGAAGPFIPCLTFRSITGAVIARCPAPEVAAGDTAEVSWFPSVGSSASGTGIRYDTLNTGDWLYVKTTGAGGPHGDGIEFDEAGGGSINVHTSGSTGDGSIDIDALNLSPNGGGRPDGSSVGVLASLDFNVLAGGDVNLEAGPNAHYPGTGNDVNVAAARDVNVASDGDTSIDAGGNVLMASLPTIDPGVTGALWNNAGVLNVSP